MSRLLLLVFTALPAIMGAAHRRNAGKRRREREEAEGRSSGIGPYAAGAAATAVNTGVSEGIKHAHHVYDDKHRHRHDDNTGTDNGNDPGGYDPPDVTFDPPDFG